MESEFLSILTQVERNSFLIYSRSLKDLAQFFKVKKDPQPKEFLDEEEAVTREHKKKKAKQEKDNDNIRNRLIFGVGTIPSATFHSSTPNNQSRPIEIIPTPIAGFVRYQEKEANASRKSIYTKMRTMVKNQSLKSSSQES